MWTSKRSTSRTRPSAIDSNSKVPDLDIRVERSLLPVVARWARQDKEVLRPLFRLIVSGQRLDEAQLAQVLNRETASVTAALRSGLVNIDSHGRVTELFGVTREPTLHRVEVGGATVYSCCALVAHMVPAIMQQDVTIRSTDPVDGSDIELSLSADSDLQQVEPPTACGSLVDCDVEDINIDPRAKFCCHVKHFAGPASASEFSVEDSARYIMTIEDFHNASQWLFREIWL